MSEFAVRARNVSKSYRLYNNPTDRLLDLFGLLLNAGAKVQEHHALQDVTFDIRCGEKVAIIGRNGAGKSTLLKLITRVTEPSSGKMEVAGQSRALLQIGTGFHPDFTGRENVAAYLASLGVPDRDAPAMVEDAIAFAELEDYADQPVKTYSTGMGMRLMFAASTMMKPELLVIDEVLGVGDAYFQRKSFERIREMCEGRQTTLLLVTHDIYSAMSLCDRMIWIDRGRVLIDADPPTVVRAYEDAVREQEERRLRQKALTFANERGERAQKERLLVEIHTKENQPPAAQVWFSKISLLRQGVPIASLRFGEDAFEDKEHTHLMRDGANWGEFGFVQGRLARPLLGYGSPFHKVGGAFEIDAVGAVDPKDYSFSIDYMMHEPVELRIMLSSMAWRVDLGGIPMQIGAWTTFETDTAAQIETPQARTSEAPRIVASPEDASAKISNDVNTKGIYGAGDIRITSFKVRDVRGRETPVLDVKVPVTFELDYVIARPDLTERAHLILAFKRDSVEDVFRVFCTDLLFDAESGRSGVLTARLDPLPLAQGKYSIAILVAAEGYYSNNQGQYFSINPKVYFAQSVAAEISIIGVNPFYEGTAVVGNADWTLTPHRSPATAP